MKDVKPPLSYDVRRYWRIILSTTSHVYLLAGTGKPRLRNAAVEISEIEKGGVRSIGKCEQTLQISSLTFGHTNVRPNTVVDRRQRSNRTDCCTNKDIEEKRGTVRPVPRTSKTPRPDADPPRAGEHSAHTSESTRGTKDRHRQQTGTRGEYGTKQGHRRRDTTYMYTHATQAR